MSLLSPQWLFALRGAVSTPPLTPLSLLSADALPEADSSMDAVVLAGLPTELPLKMFHEVLRVLVPGGMVQTSYLVSEHTIAKTEETVNSDLLMGGFVGSASVISTLRSQASVQLSVSFTATKPSYGADGGAQKLRLCIRAGPPDHVGKPTRAQMPSVLFLHVII